MNITLALHFWSRSGMTNDEAEADIQRQAQEWAAAEPNVHSIKVATVDRPYRDRETWWEAVCDIELVEVEQPTLWAAP